jgi:hypothetical protein
MGRAEVTFGQGDGAGAHAIGDGTSPLAVDFHGDGTLQEADGDGEAVHLVGISEDPFQPCQRAALYVYLRSDAEEGPRLGGEPGAKDGANGLDFLDVHGDGELAGADDTDDAGRGEDGQAIIHVKLAEQIAREEREFHLLDAVRPAPARAIEGKELFVALAAKGVGGEAA